MRIQSVARHLRPYIMLSSRRTTINHAFAAAVAPSDAYDEAVVSNAMRVLGLDPDDELACAYCGVPAETWDHVNATVKATKFSGHGHRLGNLLPCCKSCNSKKGNKAWEAHLSSLPMPDAERLHRAMLIRRYLDTYAVVDDLPADTEDLRELAKIRLAVLALLEEGDRLAARVRHRASLGSHHE